MYDIIEKPDAGFFLEKQKGKSFIKFHTGNTLIIDEVAGELKLTSKNDSLQLLIKVNGESLEVYTNASQLNINTTEEINLTSKKINIEASELLNIKTAGNLVIGAAKDCLTEIAGTNKSIARVQKLTATLGSVEIKANDDVRLDGERVKLNCD